MNFELNQALENSIMNEIKIRYTIISILVLIILTSGCDQKVSLVYNNPVAEVFSDNYGFIQIENPTTSDFKKKGNGLTVIGDVRNSFNMKIGKYLAKDSISEWIVQALTKELYAAGFKPQFVNTLDSSEGNGIKTSIIKVWVNVNTTVSTCEIHLRMALYCNGKRSKEFVVEGIGYGANIFLGPIPKDSLRIALEECMKKAIPIIIDTYSKEQ